MCRTDKANQNDSDISTRCASVLTQQRNDLRDVRRSSLPTEYRSGFPVIPDEVVRLNIQCVIRPIEIAFEGYFRSRPVSADVTLIDNIDRVPGVIDLMICCVLRFSARERVCLSPDE